MRARSPYGLHARPIAQAAGALQAPRGVRSGQRKIGRAAIGGRHLPPQLREEQIRQQEPGNDERGLLQAPFPLG